jgi:hypothetical protein
VYRIFSGSSPPAENASANSGLHGRQVAPVQFVDWFDQAFPATLGGSSAFKRKGILL